MSTNNVKILNEMNDGDLSVNTTKRSTKHYCKTNRLCRRQATSFIGATSNVSTSQCNSSLTVSSLKHSKLSISLAPMHYYTKTYWCKYWRCLLQLRKAEKSHSESASGLISWSLILCSVTTVQTAQRQLQAVCAVQLDLLMSHTQHHVTINDQQMTHHLLCHEWLASFSDPLHLKCTTTHVTRSTLARASHVNCLRQMLPVIITTSM